MTLDVSVVMFRPDDDGSFRRRDNNRRDQDDFQPSRGDADQNWRRGGGGSGPPSGGYRDEGSNRGRFEGSRGGGFEDRSFDRRGDNRDSRGFDRRGGDRGGYDDRHGGGGDRRYDNRDRGGFDRGFDRRGGGGGYDNSRDRGGFDRNTSAATSGSSSTGGARTKLQLKARTAPVVEDAKNSTLESIKKDENDINAESKLESDEIGATKTEVVEISSSPDDGEFYVKYGLSEDEKASGDEKLTTEDEKMPQRRREPDVVNSRAAALETAPNVRRENVCTTCLQKLQSTLLHIYVLLIAVPFARYFFLCMSLFVIFTCSQQNATNDNRRVDRQDGNRGPPPVMNKRFEQLAEQERDKQKERESRRGPPPVANSRFAAVAEADRGNRDGQRHREDRGPPPVANSRFAAAAEVDRNYSRDKNESADRGPPPVANSRFAAAAEADRDYRRDDYGARRDDRGPPPVANSRFAAAAEADRDYGRDDYGGRRDDRGPPPVTNSRFAAAAAMAEEEGGYKRENREGRFGRNDRDDGPPVPQNSRFAAAVAADPEYVERNERDRQDDRGERGGFGRGRDGYGYESRGRREYDDTPGYGGGRFDAPAREPSYEEPKSSVADLLKPKARPMEENILKVPTKDQADNVLKPPSKEHADNILKPPTTAKTSPSDTKENKVTPSPSPFPSITNVDDSAVLAGFVSGDKFGDDLKNWLNEQNPMPSVERLVFHLLTETEKMSPDVECAWADPGKYGAALLSLVEDDLLKQVEVLFAIQKYCDKIGMPKLNDEYVIQAMFGPCTSLTWQVMKRS